MDTDQAKQADAKSTSSSSDDGGDVMLMSITLNRANIATAGMTSQQIRDRYQQHRAEADRSAEERDRAATEDRLKRLRRAHEENMREALERRKIDATGMSIEQMETKLAYLQAADREREAESRRRREVDQRKQRAAALFALAQCPERHVANMAMAEATDNPRWKAVRDQLVDRIQYADGFLVALLGIRGPGKTQIAVSVIHRATAQMCTARYVKAMDLFRLIRRAFASRERGEASEMEDDIVEELVAFDLLVIDELDQRGQTDWEQNVLVNLIDRRYDARKCTLLISNAEKPNFAAMMGASVASRIAETGESIECEWPSYRRPGSWKTRGDEPRKPSGQVNESREDL
jgi:DNA replication protein DnaC